MNPAPPVTRIRTASDCSGLLAQMAGKNRLEVEVIKGVRAPVVPAFPRSILLRAASLPEVDARLPDGTSTIAVRLTGDEELRRLNRVYAGKFRPWKDGRLYVEAPASVEIGAALDILRKKFA